MLDVDLPTVLLEDELLTDKLEELLTLKDDEDEDETDNDDAVDSLSSLLVL